MRPSRGAEREAEKVDDYRGLFWQRPAVAAIFTAVLLSLAGSLLTAGFLGKFYVLVAGVDKALWVLAFAPVLTSAVGAFTFAANARYTRRAEQEPCSGATEEVKEHR